MPRLTKKKIEKIASGIGGYYNPSTGDFISNVDLIGGCDPNGYKLNKNGFYKTFYVYDRNNMKKIKTMERGILSERLAYGIREGNRLSEIYIEEKLKECTKKTLYGYINNLIDANYIKRYKVGIYIVNPDVAICGTGIKNEVWDMFKVEDIKSNINDIEI